jgi:MFS family permease
VIGYACTKGCIYGLLFWLPTYLDDRGMASEKGYIASMVDIGTFVGGMGVGYLGDRYQYRALFLSPFLFLSAGMMFIVSYALTTVPWTYYLFMFLIGVLTGGPYNIIGTAITIDIGEQVGKKNIPSVSALIEGSAAVFAALSQIVISVIPSGVIFYLFCGECLLSAFSLLPLFLRDLKEFRSKR